MKIIFVLVSILASVAGSICGIGGGIIIKPVMDAFNIYSASTISFMSGIIVLCMTIYSLVHAKVTHCCHIDKKHTPLLAVGAAIGGIAGKIIFDVIKEVTGCEENVRFVQSIVLMLLTCFTLIYNINKSKVHTRNLNGPVYCILLGLMLGALSSFLGIGGGPINLVILHYFFSMESKEAAQNSLFIILLSQAANLLYTIIFSTVPYFPVVLLIIMACGGVLGGIIGQAVNKRISCQTVDKLFSAMMGLIILICIYNAVRSFLVIS